METPEISITQPPSMQKDLRKAVILTRLVVATYFVILGLAAVALALVLFWAKPRDTEYGWPSFTDIALLLVAGFSGMMIVYYMVTSALHPRRDRALRTVPLEPTEEPDLHELVKRLCAELNAPQPARICASPRAEILFGPRDSASEAPAAGTVPAGFELTVGLPFVYGLSTAELAALVARELAYHADTPLAPARRFIRSANDWLQRVARSPSRFETAVHELCESSSGIANTIGATARYGFVLVRGIQRGVVLLAHAANHKVMRAWALEADLAAAHVIGSDGYAHLMTRRAQIEAAAGNALRDMRIVFPTDRLPEDFPAYAAELACDPAQDARDDAEAALAAAGKARWAPEPTFAERLRRILRPKVPAALADERPATAVFHKLLATCSDASVQYYDDIFGPDAQFVLYLSVKEFREKRRLAREPLAPLPAGPGVLGRYTRPVRRGAGTLLVATSLFMVWRGADRLYHDSTRPSGAAYRSHEGEVLVFEDAGARVIQSARYLYKGEYVASKYESGTGRAVRAPSTGWYYICGAIIKRCDEIREADFGVGNENPIRWK